MAIRRRKGKWQARVFLRWEIGEDGARRRKNVERTFRLKEDAERWEREQLDRRDRGTLRPTRDTLEAFYLAWKAEPREGLRERTRMQYERLYEKHLRAHLGAIRLDQLRRQHIRPVLLRIATERGARTAQYARAVLHLLLQHAVEEDLLVVNPASAIRLPKRTEREARTLAPDEVHRLLNVAEAREVAALEAAAEREGKLPEAIYRPPPLVAALWCVMAYTGLRPSEALALRWDDVDLERRILHVRHNLVRLGKKREPNDTVPTWQLLKPKTEKSERSVVLAEPVVEALTRHRGRQFREMQRVRDYRDHGFVFATHTGEPLREDVAYKSHFRRALSEAGLQATELPEGERRIRLHDLRHTTGSLLMEAGVPLKVASELLGHSDVKITANRYTHVRSEVQAKAVEQLERYMAKKAAGKAGKPAKRAAR